MPGLKRSPWILHYDASSCNGCDIEVLACLTPLYDVERFGVINTGNPKHADIFLVTGSVNEQNREVLCNIYRQLPEPKVVVALGICATSGGIFAECYNIAGGVDKVIPVDVYVPGCAVRPEAIIDGVVKALDVLDEKRRIMRANEGRLDQMILQKATADDLPAILALQKIAYASEAELYGDTSIQPLRQTLADMQEEFASATFLTAIMNGKIVGSVRAVMDGTTCRIGRLIVHPYFWNRGMGQRLMGAIEAQFPGAARYELFTGHLSRRNLTLYRKLGYREFRSDKLSDTITRVYMEKARP